MKPSLVWRILALSGIAVLAYVLIAPRRESPGTSNASAVPSAISTPQNSPAIKETPMQGPMVRPPSTITTLEISPEKANEELIQELSSFPNLKVLKIICLEDLAVLPSDLGKLTHLKELNMDEGNGCAMNPILPESIGNLQSLEKLNLAGAQDPRDVDKSQEKRSGEYHKFPASMSKLKGLTYLNLGRNGLSEIPLFVRDLPRLQEFDFSWNMEVKEIPAFVAELRNLTTLNLESDGLTDLPQFLSKHPKLNKISLGNNCAITNNPAKRQDLQRRFPKIKFDFQDEYDCSDK
jgi:Leucine-rich repeat (LRR) protein